MRIQGLGFGVSDRAELTAPGVMVMLAGEPSRCTPTAFTDTLRIRVEALRFGVSASRVKALGFGVICKPGRCTPTAFTDTLRVRV